MLIICEKYAEEDYLYIAWRKVIKRLYRLPNRIHNFIIMKGIYIETRLDRRLAKVIFTMIKHNNDVVKSITIFKLFSPSSVSADIDISYIYFLI